MLSSDYEVRSWSEFRYVQISDNFRISYFGLQKIKNKNSTFIFHSNFQTKFSIFYCKTALTNAPVQLVLNKLPMARILSVIIVKQRSIYSVYLCIFSNQNKSCLCWAVILPSTRYVCTFYGALYATNLFELPEYQKIIII